MTCHNCNSECKKAGFFGRQRIQRFQCKQCGRKFSDIPERPLDDLRVPLFKAVQILGMLVEGMSVRGCERLTGVHRDTVLRILETAGQKCEQLLEREITNVFAESVQIDECFTRVRCIQKHASHREEGDQYLMTAISRNSKLIIAHIVSKRDGDSAHELAEIMERRINGRFQLTSDGYAAFLDAVKSVLRPVVDYAIQTKTFANIIPEECRRYSPGKCTSVTTRVMFGHPVRELVSTSHVERSNLSIRHFNKRFTRLTLGYSKKLQNLRHACALYVAHFNFCRVHSSLDGNTPAMAAGLTGHKWNIQDLLQSEPEMPTTLTR